ncbi:MAG: ribonuclease III [Candidatus Aminicenantaceae bacterium]|jgi:ribonuclease-3
MMINIDQCEKKIGYQFKNQDLLLQALTHSSYAYENQQADISDNEVLEFLGDSVLGLIIADFLCGVYPKLSEGELSKLKSAAASTSALDYFARKIRLDKFIRLGKGEDKSGGRKKKTILAGTYEAVIAAIYLDGGIEPARDFVLKFLRTLFKRINIKKFFVNNYKSALQEYLQRENATSPIYKTVTTKGPDHKRSFFVEVFAEDKLLAKAKGNSKKEAEKKAAQKALKSLLGRKIRTLTTDTFLLKRKHH